MRKILLVFLFIIPLLITKAQNESGDRLVQRVNMALGINGEGVKEKVMYFQVPWKDRAIFSTVSFKFYRIQAEALSVEIAYADKDGNFTDWKQLQFDPHIPENSDFIVTQMEIIEPEYERLRIKLNTNVVKKFKSEAHWYLPPTEDYSLERNTLPQFDLQANCVLPQYVTRTGWNCPTGQAMSNGNPSYTNVTHLAVHHSAGSNSSSNWAARILAIWNYHVNTNGWADIAYNFLIDPNGIIYEGRGSNQGYAVDVLSAATCGSNSGSMSVCIVGNYETVQPSAAALAALQNLLAWKADDKNINATGSSSLNNYGVLNHIFGHRQGCATACPGQNLYNQLPNVRVSVADEVANGCTEGIPSVSTVSFTLDDNNDGDSQGNNDGVVDQGETIEMYLTINNNGNVPLNNVIATISTSDPCVSFIDDDIAYAGTINVGQSATNGDFDVVFGNDCSGDIDFTITYTFTGGSFTESITINVNDSGTPCQDPVANFTMNPLNGVAPLPVLASNLTTGGQTYAWRVTGPETHVSSEVNPVFILETPGEYDVLLLAFNECGQGSAVKNNYVTVGNLTGVTDNEMIATVYPNPVKRKLNVQLSDGIANGQYNIINAAGQQMLNGSFAGSQMQINVRTLASGTYILQVIDSNNPEEAFNHTFVKKP